MLGYPYLRMALSGGTLNALAVELSSGVAEWYVFPHSAVELYGGNGGNGGNSTFVAWWQ